MRIPRFRGDLPQRRHDRPSGVAPGRAKRLAHGGISLGHRRWPAPWLFFCVSASAAKSWLGLGMDELRQLPRRQFCVPRLDVGKRWWRARLAAMPIDAHFRVRGPRQLRVSAKRLPHAGLSHPPSGGKPDGSCAFGSCGWTGRPLLEGCTPKNSALAPIRPRASRRFPPNRGSPPALAGPSE